MKLLKRLAAVALLALFASSAVADTTTTNLLMTNQITGGNVNTWGDVADANFETLDNKLGDVTAGPTTGGTTSLTSTEELVSTLNVTGTLSSDATIVFSGRGGVWVVKNGTTGSFSLTVKASGQTGTTITQGTSNVVYCCISSDVARLQPNPDSATEVTVASTTTTDVLGANSDFVKVTGTTTITSLGTTANVNKFVRFTGILTLTHNATSLILPTTANITTAAGDSMVVGSNGSGNAIVYAYQRATGAPLTLGSGTLGGSATLSGNLTFGGTTAHSGAATFSSTAALGAGGSLAGTFSGSPTFSGTPVLSAGASLTGTFSGSPTFSGTPVFTGANLQTNTYSGAAVFSGNLSFTGTPNFSNSPTIASRALREMPVGTVFDFAGTTCPALSLATYGQAISRSTYSVLFTAISTNWGAGDGSTFNLPDLRGRVVAMEDDAGGLASSANRLTAATSQGFNGDTFAASGGEEAHTQTSSEVNNHTHTYSSTSGAGTSHSHSFSDTSSSTSVTHTHSFSDTTSSDGSHTHSYTDRGDADASVGSSGNTVADNSSSSYTTGSGGSHTHTVSGTTGNASVGHTHDVSGTTGSDAAHTHAVSGTTASSGSSSAFNVLQPTAVMSKCIYAGV